MKKLGAFVGVFMLFAPAIASAAGPETCTSSYERAQVLRQQGKLVAARDQLQVCGGASCPNLIVGDCTKWLEELQSTLPSVVPLATDDAGTNLIDVKVSVDGTPLTNAPAGQAVDLDPGPHHFTFERGDSFKAETDVLVAVGEKNKRVAVVLRKTPAALGTPPATSSGSSSRLGKVGLVVAAVGVVGVGVGVVYGAEAIAHQSDADCPGNRCPPGSNPTALRTAQSDGNVSTVFFVAGGVLAAAGVTTWLLTPSRHSGSSAWVRPGPMAVANGGGGVLVGGW